MKSKSYKMKYTPTEEQLVKDLSERRMMMTEFISRKYGMEGYEIIIKTDSHEHYRETEDFARRLIDHSKPATNADRIRSMSDEQLAVAIAECTFTGACNDFGITVNVKCCRNCTKCTGIIDWLKQPAEVSE